MVFVRNGTIAKRIESLEGKESETIYVEVTLGISKKMFAYRPQQNNIRVMLSMD